MVPDAEFTSYYGRPVIKEPVWRVPDVPGYLFLGGLAGASSVLAAGSQLSGYRELAREKDVLTYFYVVDGEEQLQGVVGLRELVAAEPGQTLGALMTEQLITLHPEETLRDAVHAIARRP